MNIFLAEGFAHTRERLCEALGALPGVCISGSADGARAAIAAILQAKPEVVILGLKLAEGSGFDVLREVHAAEPGIDFYMVSNFESEPYRRHAERLGALGFFDKSQGLEPLRDAIARRLAEHPLARAQQQPGGEAAAEHGDGRREHLAR